MSKTKVKRTPMHVYKCNVKVQKDLDKLANKKGVAKWLIIEKMLEGQINPKFNFQNWIKTL